MRCLPVTKLAVSIYVLRPLGAAFIGVCTAELMAGLHGFERPLFALAFAVAIVMVIRLLEETSDTPS